MNSSSLILMIMFIFSHRITVVVKMVSLLNIVQGQNGGLIEAVISRPV